MRYWVLYPVVLLLGSFMTAQASPKMEIPSVIGDHMVFQQEAPIVVWGKDAPSQAVTVSLNGSSATAQADTFGKWKAELPAMKAGGPYELVVSGSESKTFQDVLVGEVWFASGQSNMEFKMPTSRDAGSDIPKANYPQIRLFVQDRCASAQALDKTSGSWEVCTPDSVKDFSAVAYYFGKNLHQELKEPVGLIDSCWGGTPIETWMPHSVLEANPAFQTVLAREKAMPEADKKVWADGVDMELELSGIRFIPKDPTQQPLTVLTGTAAQPVPGKTLGGIWSANAVTGSAVSYVSSDIKGPAPGPVGRLSGHFPGGAWGSADARLSPDGNPVDLSAYGSLEFYARGKGHFKIALSQPSIIDWDENASDPFEATDQWKLQKIDLGTLKQGGWGIVRPLTLGSINDLFFQIVLPTSNPDVPSFLYNGMVSPFIPLRIRGVLWYQGETNADSRDRAEEYRLQLPALIESWREAWGEGDFPFIYAQLPNFMDPQPQPSESNWALIREAELLALKEPKTGMAVLIDLGEAKDIHPKDKTDVGYRMFLKAMNSAYGSAASGSGPLYAGMKVEGNKIRITFTQPEVGLTVKGGGELKGFAVAGADGQFKWAKAKIEGDSVIVWNDKIPSPKAARYAWADNPLCNLWGKNGLPASPFRTDYPGAPEILK